MQIKFRELVQKIGVKSQVPYVHYATHNQNLVVNNTVQGGGATAERSFSKLKIIKNYLRSTTSSGSNGLTGNALH